MTDAKMEPAGCPGAQPSAGQGVVLGVIAVVCWSFGASLVYVGAQEVGTWAFVALSSLSGGVLQLIFRRWHHGELRSAVQLPWRLWLVPVLCFVTYGLVWPWALAMSGARQVFGVSLINYLWPVLTVLLSAWWVPGVRLTPRVLAALLLALAGLIAANLSHLRELFSTAAGANGSVAWRLLPYLLAGAAALTWAIYSAAIARWRSWAGRYATSPAGFIVIGLVAGVVVAWTRTVPSRWTLMGTCWTILYGAGPLAAGYLLWEMALARAKVQTLSLIAACTPILSTLLLCLFLRTLPSGELILAACLVSGGVVLSLSE